MVLQLFCCVPTVCLCSFTSWQYYMGECRHGLGNLFYGSIRVLKGVAKVVVNTNIRCADL